MNRSPAPAWRQARKPKPEEAAPPAGTKCGFRQPGRRDGIASAVLSPALFERRLVVTHESWLRIAGRVSRCKGPPVVQARRVARLELPALHTLADAGSHDFR